MAVIVTEVELVTAVVVMLNVEEVSPAGTVTVAGTAAAEALLLLNPTTMPPTGAAPFNLTVLFVVVAPPITVAGCRAIDAATGQLIWKSAITNGSFGGADSVANGVVYGRSYFWFYAFDAANGETLWILPVGSEVGSSPAVANGLVYEGPYASNAVTGQLLWTGPIAGYVLATAAVANGVVYLAGGNLGTPNLDDVYALDGTTGQIAWTAATDGPNQTALAVANGVLYVTSPTSVYAFHLPHASAPPPRPEPATLKPDVKLLPG